MQNQQALKQQYDTARDLQDTASTAEDSRDLIKAVTTLAIAVGLPFGGLAAYLKRL